MDANEDAYEDEEELAGPDDYCECGRPALGDHCRQCGRALCPMCSETGAGFCKDHPNEDFNDDWQEDAYEDLRNATPEELRDAMIWFIRQSIKPPGIADQLVSYLLTGWRLARPSGWMNIAPMWLRESRKEGGEG